MRCKCGGKTKVVNTRDTVLEGEAAQERRRSCVTCHIRFSTIEVILEHTVANGPRIMGVGRNRKPLNRAQVTRNAEARRILENLKDGAEAD